MARILALSFLGLISVDAIATGAVVDGDGGPRDLYNLVRLDQDLQGRIQGDVLTGDLLPPHQKSAVRDISDGQFEALAASIPRFQELTVVGDSYSSGDGALNSWGEGRCKRNQGSFGVRLSKLLSPINFNFLPCSGAPVSRILAEQVNGPSYGAPDLVLFTAGGDNGGSFVKVLLSCILQPSERRCNSALELAAEVAKNLPASLQPLYEAMSGKASPSGHKRELIHIGYVQMYNRDQPNTQCPAHGAGQGSDVTWPTTGAGGYREKINKAIEYINRQIEATAAKHGVKYIDVNPYFEGHRFCDGPDASWMQHRLTFKEDGVICHPSFDGHGAYIEAILEYLAS